jgi:hypothetical protein
VSRKAILSKIFFADEELMDGSPAMRDYLKACRRG